MTRSNAFAVTPKNLSAVGHTCALEINASALIDNHQLLRSKVGKNCEVAAVVKANAYGLGLEFVAPILESAGCEFFYVANLNEGIKLRSISDKKIAVMAGCWRGEEDEFIRHHLIPVLISVEQVGTWPAHYPCIWHIDTGMNRLGIETDQIAKLIHLPHFCAGKAANLPLYMMTHFTSSEVLDESSAAQVAKFDQSLKNAGIGRDSGVTIPQSLCNSSAIFRDEEWHRQQVRAGMALYGLNPTPYLPQNPMRDVVRLSARILQVRHAKKGETVGYNQTYTIPQDTILAVIGYGYADGFHRAGSNKSNVYWHGVPCPVRGLVSMDLSIVDIGHLHAQHSSIHSLIPLPKAGDEMDILPDSAAIEQLARDWNTNVYEILTSISPRARRAVME